MDWQRSLSDWKEHLPWLSPLVGAGALLVRKRRWRPWQSLIRQFNLNAEIDTCRQDLANERASKDFAMTALREITMAAAMVKAAADEGRMTITDSWSAPANSPATSSGSSTMPVDRPATRSPSD